MQYDIRLMWQVLIYPMAICISSLFHEGAYWITSKWHLWNIKRLLHHGIAVVHSSIIKIHSNIQYNKDIQGEKI